MEFIYIFFFVGIFFGLFMTFLWDFLEKRILFRRIKTEAKHILEDAHEKVEESLAFYKRESEKKNEKKRNIFEKERDILNSNLQDIEDKIEEKRNKIQLERTYLKNQNYKNQKHIQSLKEEGTRLFKEKQENQNFIQDYRAKRITQLQSVADIEMKILKEDIKKVLKDDWKEYVKNNTITELINLEDRQNLKKSAVFYLKLALNRFQRSYCSERGIPSVKFKSKNHLENTIGKNKEYLEELEKECGVDVVINEENLYLYIFGMDPVRREWGRMSLEKLSLRNKVNPSAVKKIIRLTKERLFTKIQNDGVAICKRLKLRNVAPEVQNMMGALRYRYSFAQNQHFHCEEVGWLCGLLSSEMELPLKKGQRAGMFHDIGKAMDHSMEGGHAVIGAEFLSQYNENEDVIHAVKAHHHDEEPSSPLAYLVITADSISGSRPGARRFTEDSYNQKIASLEKILQSFEVVEDFYIMNAAREIRVIVNAEKVDDEGVISLSQEIAKEVEKECSYPGLIKITTIRKSEVFATTA